ncbi:hypothetical protein ES708_03718 [subsurface metagenome]
MRSKGAFGRATEEEHIERHSDTSGANKTGGKRPMRSKGAKAKGWVGDLAAMRTWEGISAKALKHLDVCRRAAKTTHTPPLSESRGFFSLRFLSGLKKPCGLISTFWANLFFAVLKRSDRTSP